MRLPFAVLCLLGMTSLLSIQPLAAAAEPTISSADAWIGVVTLTSADGVIQREGKNLRVLRGAGILPGDVVLSGSSSPLAITFFDGPALTLSNASEIQLAGDSDALQLGLNSGELRIVHDGQMPVVVESPELGIQVDRAIVRMQRQGNETHCELTTGAAALRVGVQERYPMHAGEVYAGNARGIGQVSNDISWQIHPEQVRLAAAIQTAPQLQAPPTSNAPAPIPNQPNTPAAAPGTQTNQDLAQIEEEQRRRRARGGNLESASARGVSTPAFSGSSSLSLGSFSGSISAFSSGGLAADAGQQTFQGKLKGSDPPVSFPGQIHLVTKESTHPFSDVQLNASEIAQLSGNNYYSIGEGAPPTSQVVTDALTASSPTPVTQAIPQFNAHVVRLDQYGAVDPVVDPNGALASNAAITGLVGATPSGPTVVGTAPLLDERAAFNRTATFALGEFRVNVDPATGAFSLGARSSDQDRLIEKDINGNDANDLVTKNPDVAFTDVTDSRFLPQSPTVKVPVKDSLSNRATSYRDLSPVRRAAFTTILADSLYNYSLRTGQTRFVVDGRIVDISGYKRP